MTELKIYTIELTAYPQEFIITAESESEAILKATERFQQSVYESNVTDVQPLTDSDTQ